MLHSLKRRSVLAMAGGALLASTMFAPAFAQDADKPTYAMIQINQQALFFNQMIEGAQKAADEAAAARAEWCETESSQLAGALLEQTDRLAAALKVTLTSVLKPVALGARRRQTVAELVETVASLTFDGRALGLKASGSADLLEALEAALGARAGLVSFEPVDGKADVRIVCDQTVIETRLADWRSAFEKALA